MISKGDLIGGYEVIAAHAQEDHDGKTQGVALGYDPHKREYGVWLVNGDDAHGGIYTFDPDRALMRYIERVIDRMQAFNNKLSPGVSFDVRPRASI